MLRSLLQFWNLGAGYLLCLIAATTAGQTADQQIYSFHGNDGVYPNGLVLASNGLMYGTTQGGGVSGSGTFFQLDPTRGLNVNTVTSLYSFQPINGASPNELAVGADGYLYGTCKYGGAYSNAFGGFGSVFKISPAGTFALLNWFDGTNGMNPAAGLVQGSDGLFYGTTTFGGKFDSGTVFQVSTNGSLIALVSLDRASGCQPSAKLLKASNGSFYGTTTSFGPQGGGTVFNVTTNGVLTVVAAFEHPGSFPGALTECSDGHLYGATETGGAHGYGSVFRLGTNGNLTTLVSFDGSNGAYPRTTLFETPDHLLVGTTSGGGIYNRGTAFTLSTNGTHTVLFSFGASGPESPSPAMVLWRDGRIYGTTSSGGGLGYGTAYRILEPVAYRPVPVTSLTVHERLVERMLCPGYDSDPDCDVLPSGVFTFRCTVNWKNAVDIKTFDENTTFELSIGDFGGSWNFFHDPKYQRGKRSVAFVEGYHVQHRFLAIMKVRLDWNSERLIFSGAINLREGTILSGAYTNLAGRFADTNEFSAKFADLTMTQAVPISGVARHRTSSRRVGGTVTNANLATVVLKGAVRK